MNVYAKQILSSDSDITGSEKVVAASKAIVKEKTALKLQRTVDDWTAAHRFVYVEVSPAHLVHFFETMYKNATLFVKFPHISLSQRYQRRRSCFYSTDLDTFLAFDTSAQVIKAKKSRISDPDAGMGFFLLGQLGKARLPGTSINLWNMQT